MSEGANFQNSLFHPEVLEAPLLIPSQGESDYSLQGLDSIQATELLKKWGYNEHYSTNSSIYWDLIFHIFSPTTCTVAILCIIAIITENYVVFGITLGLWLIMFFLNYQEMRSKRLVEETALSYKLTRLAETKIAALRDGHWEYIQTKLLVPGDIVRLIGGLEVPADVEWLQGDVLSVYVISKDGTNQYAIQQCPSNEHDKMILCHSTICSGEAYGVVRKTGKNVDGFYVANSNMEIAVTKNRAREMRSLENQILGKMKGLVWIVLLAILILFLIRRYSNGYKMDENDLLQGCLSILIVAASSIMIQPMMQIFMTWTARFLATKKNAIVTSLSIFEDLAAMSILCADCVGTFTTSNLTVKEDLIWYGNQHKTVHSAGLEIDELLLFAALASEQTADNKFRVGMHDICIHKCLESKVRSSAPQVRAILQEYTLTEKQQTGTTTMHIYFHPNHGSITIVKGDPIRMFDDFSSIKIGDESIMFDVDLQSLREEVNKVNEVLVADGYETIGVLLKCNNEPIRYLGIIPIFDPPRSETREVIQKFHQIGVDVKLMTGYLLPQAQLTSRAIGLDPTKIMDVKQVKLDSQQQSHRDCIIRSDGYSHVYGQEKMEIVSVLKTLGICGVTGDSANDGGAMITAQVAIAVDCSSDEAKNCSDLVLTESGLRPIFDAVIESRRLCQKLQVYLISNFVGFIYLVTVLMLLMFISNCFVDPLLLLFLVIRHGMTLFFIYLDKSTAVPQVPIKPNLFNMMIYMMIISILLTISSMIFVYAIEDSGWFSGHFSNEYCGKETQGAIWLQVLIAIEFLQVMMKSQPKQSMWISVMHLSVKDCMFVFAPVLLTGIVASILTSFSSFFGDLSMRDVAIIWCYDFIVLTIVDLIRVFILPV